MFLEIENNITQRFVRMQIVENSLIKDKNLIRFYYTNFLFDERLKFNNKLLKI